MLPTPFLLSSDQRRRRSLTQDVIPFRNNNTFQYTNPLSSETKAYLLHTIPLIREHCDSYLYYPRYKTLEITPSQTTFQVIFHSSPWYKHRKILWNNTPTKNHIIVSRCFFNLNRQAHRIQ